MKKMVSLSLLLILSFTIVSCVSKKDDTPDLLATGEYATAEEMEALKAEALSWQSKWFGTTNKADIVAIEPADGSNQQIYISFQQYDETEVSMTPYERFEIQMIDGAHARVFQATGGGGSGDYYLLFKFEKEASVWLEAFWTSWDEGIPRIWKNVTQKDDSDFLLKLTPEERESWTNLFD